MLSLIDLLALTFFTGSVAKRLLAHWYTATAFLLNRFASLGLKVMLGGLKSLGKYPLGAKTSVESNIWSILK